MRLRAGTLLLDEIGELPLELQPLLLRALQERAIRPVGAESRAGRDVRVIAATNVRLDTAVTSGRFRGDLYARLAQIPLEIPPLRERREEILGLAEGFATRRSDAAAHHRRRGRGAPLVALALQRARARKSRPPLVCDGGARGAGNGVLAWGKPRVSGSVPGPCLEAPEPRSGTHAVNGPSLERAELEGMLRSCDGDISEVARRLSTTRAQVYRLIERLGLERPPGRTTPRRADAADSSRPTTARGAKRRFARGARPVRW